jgi:lipoate-protein ligase A
MRCLDLTFPTPAENLAGDEALWEAGEEGGGEWLRFWESPAHFVVLGYANHAASEVDLAACRRLGVPVQRRITGGGTVLQGPGCLNYTLVLRVTPDGPTSGIRSTNQFILQRHAAALATALGRPVRCCGDTDLVLEDRKFSGNAQRRGRRALLFHGTLLLGLNADLVRAVLPLPSRQPAYRSGRSHDDFLTNLGIETAVVKQVLRQTWAATDESGSPPLDRVRALAAAKYDRPEWVLRF